MEIIESSFTCNKVYKGDLFLFHSCLKELLDTENDTSSSGKHWVKNKNSLFFPDVLRQFVIDKDRMLVFAIFISLNEHLSNGDAREKVRDLLNHRVSRSNNGNCTVVLFIILQLVMIVMLSSG